nr:reverse transcriptase [Hymenolepis microstoma]
MKPKSKEILLTLFNRIWETSLVPTQWKVAIVIPILKRGKDPTNFDNYRPISLTSMLAKLMERMVNTRLIGFLETNNILGNEQAGFRPQRSTNRQVAKLPQHIKTDLDARNTLTAVFVGFKSAYGLIWKENLILKLAKIGMKHNMLKAFIGQRTCKVGYGNDLSKSNLLQTGLPRGAITSCSLFNVFIDGMAELVQTVMDVKCILYADDFVLWYFALKNAQKRTEIALTISKLVRQQWHGYQHIEKCIPNIFIDPPQHKSAFNVQRFSSRTDQRVHLSQSDV